SFYTKIRSTIPAIALFTGSLADNREILTEQPEKVVEALAQVIECFMTGKNDAPVILPDGTVAIVVAVSSINISLDTFQYGDSVNYHAELKFVDTEQYQTLTDSEITGAELQTMTHTIKATFLKRVIPNGVQFEVLMVAVAPDDAQVLTWLIESKVPFTLEYA